MYNGLLQTAGPTAPTVPATAKHVQEDNDKEGGSPVFRSEFNDDDDEGGTSIRRSEDWSARPELCQMF